MRKKSQILLVAILSLSFLPEVAKPCSMAASVHFWETHAPATEIPDYVAGNLGILVPFRYDRNAPFPGPILEVVAYRQLSGLGVTKDNQAILAQLIKPTWFSRRPLRDSISAWEAARRRGWPKSTPRPDIAIDAYRRIEHQYPGQNRIYYQTTQNCFSDAFDTAVTTLRDRKKRYNERELEEWLHGQDRVFFSCRGSGPLPETLDNSWRPLLRADRAYQRAAAHLYSGQHDQAIILFRKIAADEDSTWSPISTYLVARTLFRRGHPGDMAEGIRALEAILAEPALADAHDSADLLLGYFLAREDPSRRRRELAGELTAPELDLGSRSRQKLIDYGRLLSSAAQDEGTVEDLSDWILAFRAGTEKRLIATQYWLDRRSLPWLVAAAASAQRGDPAVTNLLAAIEEIPSSSPAYLTLAYHQARLLAETGHWETSRRQLDTLLERPELSISDRNRILVLQTRNAPDLETFLSYSPMHAAQIRWDDGSAGSAPIPMNRERDFRELDQHLLLGDEVVSALNRYFTPALLLRAARGESLPRPLRLQIARVAWVRAFVANDDAIAKAAASLLVELEVEPQRTGLRLYLAARPGPNQNFLATLHLLRNYTMTPVVHSIERDHKDQRLWCSGWPSSSRWWKSSDEYPGPSFLNSIELAEADSLRKLLQEMDSGQGMLGRLVLDWAAEHPEDHLLPEALHLVVRSTRRGCPGESQKKISKAAFEVLHERYPHSEWAEKTPYWFD